MKATVKLLILSLGFAGFLVISQPSSAAAVAYDDYDSCAGEAYDAYRECDYYCGTVVGTGSCFGICQDNFDNAMRDCEAQYPQ